MIIRFHESEIQKLPINLRMLGVDHQQEPISRQKGFPIFQWFYCVRGSGELMIGQERSILNQGQGALIYPRVPHAYRGLTDDWTVHFFGFTGTNCAELLKTLYMCESGVYHFSDRAVFPSYIDKLAQTHKHGTKNPDISFSKICYSFLLDLSFCIRRINAAVPVQENAIIRKITDYLEENYAQSIVLDDLAGHVQLSKDYMCALFKRIMQQTIMHYLCAVRICRARIFLLQYPEKKVLDIGRMCGFDSSSYFVKVFKKEVGVTPENYRNGK